MFKQFRQGWSSGRTRRQTGSSSTIKDAGYGQAAAEPLKLAEGKEPPQGFEAIRDQCLQEGKLWEDPDFPAEQKSMFTKEPPSCWPGVVWQRPHEICSDPQMFVDGATRMDVNQGVLGDCWLLAAVACLSTNQKLLENVFPHDQSFQDKYAGIVRCRFWQYGRWVEVLIDDRLPTKKGKLIYMHSDDKNEFWSALLEKAYAKLNGSYEALTGGLTMDALTDFTGGITSRFELGDKATKDLLHTMLKGFQKGAMMGCSIDSSLETRENQLSNGLIIGHAYSITDVRMVTIATARKSGQMPLLRIRNPWGDSHEWKGAWGDESPEWNFVSADERQSMGLTYEHDGEFWMAYEDFKTHFQRLEICFLGPDSIISDPDNIAHWESSLQDGFWQKGVNAGGCRNFPRTFWSNPQYRAHVEDVDEDDEDGNGSIIIGIMQKNRRSTGKDNVAVGYYIFRLDDPSSGTLSKGYFDSHPPTQKSMFSDLREVSGLHKMPPGEYVITPCTFDANTEADFVLRVFSERKGDEVVVLDDATDKGDVLPELADKLTDDDVTKKEEASQEFINRAGADGQMDAFELMALLNERFPLDAYKMDGFSIDMARTMIAITDNDLSGKLGFPEYKELLNDLTHFMKAFSTCDSDGNGYISSFELRYALNLLGYKVSNLTFVAIATRYKNDEHNITFDDFVTCCLKLKAVFHAFKVHDENGSGEATFPLNSFLEETVHC